MTRHLRLQGVHNFRDYGDYPTRGGGRLARGQLWRSAGHHMATDADLETIAELDLAVVVDLRTPTERAAAPSRRPERFRAKVVAGEHEAEDTWIAFLKRTEFTPAEIRAYMVEYNRKAPFEPRHLDVFTRYFRHLAEADGPILVHCAAGKDRTGLIVALTHDMLGVAEDDIIADYLLTNDPAVLEARGPIVAGHLAEHLGRAPSEEAVRVAMGVEAEYLATALATIRERHGSTEAYLRDALGVDAPMREALEARLVV
jgi:protein-tyrosine phosphatase